MGRISELKTNFEKKEGDEEKQKNLMKKFFAAWNRQIGLYSVLFYCVEIIGVIIVIVQYLQLPRRSFSYDGMFFAFLCF